MDIYDPIAIALGIHQTTDIKDYPKIEDMPKTYASNIAAWNKGIPGSTTLGMKFGPISEERRQNISNARKGSIPWNKGKQGKRPKGIPCKEETKRKMSETMKSKPRSEACIAADAQRSNSLKGRVFSPEHREKLRQAALRRYSTDSK